MTNLSTVKVLHMVTSMSPEYGGPVTMARGLTSALVQQGVHCEIVTARGLSDVLPIPGVKIHQFDTEFPAPFWRAYSRKMKRFLDAKAGSFDIIHSYETMSYVTYAAFHSARKNNIPIIIQTADSLSIPSLRYKRIRKEIYRKIILDKILKSADFLHISSNSEAIRIANMGYTTPRYVLPNGVNLYKADSYRKAKFLEEYPSLVGKRIILFLGRLHYKKGLDVLARNFATLASKFPNIVLLVVGPDDGYRSKMMSILDQFGVLDHTVFTGMLTGDHKLAAYQCADLFVSLSYSDSSSNTILEALAAGVPLVISEHCDFPEIQNHKAGFVVPLDDESICEAISKLLLDDHLVSQMGHNGRKLIEEKYTWKSIAASIIPYYQTLL